MISMFSIPVFLAAIATVAAFAAKSAFSLTAISATLLGLSVFAALMGLAAFYWTQWQTQRTERRMADLITFESDMLKRMQDMETAAFETGRAGEKSGQLEQKIQALEETSQSLSAMLDEANAEVSNKADLPGKQDFDESAFEDDKIVRLNPPSAKAAARAVAKDEAAIAGAVERGPVSIRLQPIFSLQKRKVVGVEAFAQFRVGPKDIEASELAAMASPDQRIGMDCDVLAGISRVADQMADDKQSRPIHYRLVSLENANAANWKQLTSTLQTGARFKSTLVLLISQEAFRGLKADGVKKFAALESDVKGLGLHDVTDGKLAIKSAKQNGIGIFKASAQTLLAYPANERERFADQLLPDLEKLGATVFAETIEEAHEASQLIDLDLAYGQGAYLSPPRPIKLYEAGDKKNAPKTKNQPRKQPAGDKPKTDKPTKA